VFAEQNSFLAGRDLLVTPVTEAGQTITTVYLPGDQPWYDYWTGTKHNSNQRISTDTPLDKISVFQRAGSIIPKKERVRRSSTQMAVDPYTLVVALDSNGRAEGELYVDDGHSFDYTKGHFVHRLFKFQNNQLTSVPATNSHTKSSGFDPKTTVERIVVYGLSKAPSKVTASGKELSFLFEKGKLFIRKPDFPIASDWTISLQ